ncbi:MAG TPA: hypothetical protein VFS05_02665 [Gemmatimonadaceae bacterium]|nr:hypothetical protein [Gemmatimonadaceae bacterium]
MRDTSPPGPALTPEQWRDLDYRQPARVIDAWRAEKPERRPADEPTQYIAQMGITYDGCVTLMSRAHDRVDVPPPARHALAALALHGQPFAPTPDDVRVLRETAELMEHPPSAGAAVGERGARLRDLAERLAALLPPADAEPAAPG